MPQSHGGKALNREQGTKWQWSFCRGAIPLFALSGCLVLHSGGDAGLSAAIISEARPVPGRLSGMQIGMPCHQAAKIYHILPWPLHCDSCSMQMMDMTT